MNTVTKLKIKLAAMLLAVSLVSAASAQQILTAAQTGTVQQLRQEEGFLVISGRNYNFDVEVTQTYFRGERISDTELDAGMVVRFVMENELIVRIEILGPSELVEHLTVH